MAEFLAHLQKLSVLVFLVSSMLAVGLTLTPQALLAPLRNLRLVLRTLALNFLLAPAFAWLLTVVAPLEHGHEVGLLLLGGAAGAPFLPKVVEAARGDVPLVAAIMGLLTIGTILFLPFALPLMIPGLQADAWSIARPLVLFIVIPLAVGMLVKHHAATLSTRAAPIFAMVGTAALLLLSLLIVILNARALLGVIGSGAIITALLYFVGLFVLGWLLGGSKPQERAVLGLATTARNFGAALVPAADCFNDPNVTLMIVVGATVCLAVSFIAAAWLRRRKG